MPMAVTMESTEKTRSMTVICATAAVKAPGAAPRSSLSSGPSISPWISCVALPMRKIPPAMRMMSRQENPFPRIVKTGSVMRMMAVSAKSSATRNTSASRSPMRRARSAWSLGSFETRTEMNTTLSMPSTISMAESVTSAAQPAGLATHSNMRRNSV
jgi:hypothetical protein